jgi:predicted hydrocarbon binding protein
MAQAETTRPYAFTSELLGNLEAGRPNLGPMMRVEVYRLMQFTLRDRLEAEFGTARAEAFLYDAGFTAGSWFMAHIVGPCPDLATFVARLQQSLLTMGVGVLRVEKANESGSEIILTVSEDLDCSGVPELGRPSCKYDEGFISALLTTFAGQRYAVSEVDCWTNGARTCRFVATLITP